MKKLFIISALAVTLASCMSSTAPAPTATSNDSTVVNVDSVKADTTVADTVKK